MSPTTRPAIVRSALALAVLAAPAAACPYCAISQSGDTLIYIAAFLVIPYVLVSGTWLWMRRILAVEQAEQHVPTPHADGARAS